MKDAHVTLYDVAARAGVSASTASRALAGLVVNKANRAAVEKAAADLGYVPNEAARSLRVVRTMTVGMVFFQLTSALGIELLGSLSSSLDKMGYSLFISTAQGEEDRYDQLVRRFLERRVDALLCVHGRGEGRSLDRYMSAGIPALSLITRGGGYSALPLVAGSIRKASVDCLEALAALGHQRIALALPAGPVNLVQDFLSVGGDQVSRLTGARDETGRLDADAVLAELMALEARPTAVAALYGDAVELFDAAERAGVDVPGALSIVAIRDRSARNRPTRLPLSTIHIDPSLIALKAAEILDGWLERDVRWSTDIAVEHGSWMALGTTGPAPPL